MENKKTVQFPPCRIRNGKECVALEEIRCAADDVAGKAVLIADKHGIDRDDALQCFAAVFAETAGISVYQYGDGPEKPDGAHLECSVSGDADIQCSMCGERYTADEVKELADMGEPVSFYDGKFLCPDCYDRYNRQPLEVQFETALNMGEGE